MAPSGPLGAALCILTSTPPARAVAEETTLQKFPMTAPGLAALEEELRTLKAQERPAIIRAIAEARAHGDLSENAEYHAARERQSFVEGRIAELEEITSAAEVIDPASLTGDTVKFGASILLLDEDTEKEVTYQIVAMLRSSASLAGSPSSRKSPPPRKSSIHPRSPATPSNSAPISCYWTRTPRNRSPTRSSACMRRM